MDKKIELLAPAGSFEKAKVAFMYGADAVYCGTPELSLRSRSELKSDDLERTINYAHSIGKRVHVAINIYAWDETYEEIKRQCQELNRLKADAIIVADGGVVDMIREYAPDVEIHISTQANTVSYHTCNFWKRNGAKRIILGRELNKEQIREIIAHKPEDLDIEIFGHGAICFAYSGRCFLSEFLAGRNGNLGDCAQSCRWAYNVYVEETNNPGNLMPVETDEKGTYIFSSKDLCLVREIPEIIEMGVNSLKIEGILKTEYYLATVINAYRAAIDSYYANPKEYNPENYEFGGKVIKEVDDKVLIEIRNKLSVGDTLELLVPGKIEPVAFTIDNLWDADTNEEIPTVNPGKAEQKVILKIPTKVEEGWILRRKK